MVQIDVLALIALLQALLLTTALWLIWWLRLRHLQGLLSRARALVQRLRERPDPATYLEQELEQVRAAEAHDGPPWRQAQAATLAFQLERARALSPEQQPPLDGLREALEGLFASASPAPGSAPAADTEAKPLDHQDLQEMIARLDRQLEALRNQIQGSVSNTVDRTRMMEKLDALNLVTRELESCASMMEEENDQLRAALQSAKAEG